jgi:outer membrane receptor protein involved in Fe transport
MKQKVLTIAILFLSTISAFAGDLAVGKTFDEKITASITATNIANRRVLLDNSLTFGGFHFNDPRQIYGELRYRFHF